MQTPQPPSGGDPSVTIDVPIRLGLKILPTRKKVDTRYSPPGGVVDKISLEQIVPNRPFMLHEKKYVHTVHASHSQSLHDRPLEGVNQEPLGT